MSGNDWKFEYRDTASYKAAVCLLHSINADRAFHEQLQHTDDTFPLDVRTVIYKHLIDRTVNCHWHHDYEFGLLLEGSADCYINDTFLKLSKGDVFFVNSGVLHMSVGTGSANDAVLYALTFPATLLSTSMGSSLYAKYFGPLLHKRIEGFTITADNPAGQDIREALLAIYPLAPSDFGYELACLSHFSRLWLSALRYMEENESLLLHRASDIRYSERLKRILSYIHAHFHKKITADDIAKYANISRGECFRCFKHFMSKTIVEYTNEVRLQRAAVLLRETQKRLIDISADCGFESAGYFSKSFKDVYAMTPLQYRKAKIWTENTILHSNGYDYEYWKDSGNGTMIVTQGANNGSFSCEWNAANNIIFRSGMKLGSSHKPHRQLGHITLRFDAKYSSKGCSYLCVYGWTVDPLVEWYIVECRTDLGLSDYAEYVESRDIDGGTYELYHRTRTAQPSILGIADFAQYWSVRAVNRLGGTVDVSTHLRAWESAGLSLGSITEVALSVEGCKSSGNAAVQTNVITIC